MLKVSLVNPRDASSPLHRIILNECRTKESNSPNRTTIEQIVFEMNFSSGHWRKLRRKAVVRDTSVLSARRRSKDGLHGVSELSFENRTMDRDGNAISEDDEEISWASECGRWWAVESTHLLYDDMSSAIISHPCSPYQCTVRLLWSVERIRSQHTNRDQRESFARNQEKYDDRFGA